MDTENSDLNDSIKKIAEWADLQRKLTKWGYLAIIPFLLLAVGVSIYFESKIKNIATESESKKDWYHVISASRKGELSKAIQIADELLILSPNDFEGHYKKGEILLMLGQRQEAKQCFQTAFEIFPIPKYRIAVEALSQE